jgi:hypothetical protein
VTVVVLLADEMTVATWDEPVFTILIGIFSFFSTESLPKAKKIAEKVISNRRP